VDGDRTAAAGSDHFLEDEHGQTAHRFGTRSSAPFEVQEIRVIVSVTGWNGGEMQANGTFHRIELYAGDRHLATYDNTPFQTIFIHSDWLGTERVRSRYDGSLYETCTSLPFGDQQQCPVVGGGADPSPLHFAGKMRDTETNLDYFGARYYSSGMAHWMSPDWASKPTSVPYANFGNPQSLNLYGYVGNNPLSTADKDGHVAGVDDTVIVIAVRITFTALIVHAYLQTPAGQRSPFQAVFIRSGWLGTERVRSKYAIGRATP
jgi:RHS repeat-associated protein